MKRTVEDGDAGGDGDGDEEVEAYVPVHQRRLQKIKRLREARAQQHQASEQPASAVSLRSLPPVEEDRKTKPKSLLDMAITQGRLADEGEDPAEAVAREEKAMVEVRAAVATRTPSLTCCTARP